MKSMLKVRTSFVTQGNLDSLIKAEWLPLFIIRNIQNSTLIGNYDGTPVHLYWLAPHPELYHQWRDGEITFDEYADIYADDIMSSVRFPSLLERLEILRSTACAKGVVLMGYGEDVNSCHRGVLAKMLNDSKLLAHPIKEFII